MTAERFHFKMAHYLNEYKAFLSLAKPNNISTYHFTVINDFINYLYSPHLISDAGQITVSIANSKFHNHYKKVSKETVSKEKLKNTLLDFFIFINEKHGIKNEKLIKGLKK